MMTAFLFDGHIRNITNLDYDIYITFTISAALELPADLGIENSESFAAYQYKPGGAVGKFGDHSCKDCVNLPF